MFGGFKRFRAVVNALNAKATYESLAQDRRKEIERKAQALYAGAGSISASHSDNAIKNAADAFARFSEFERYSLYSMAMIELGVDPVTPEPWDPPANPFSMRISPDDIEKAIRHFAKQHGLNISMT